MTRTILDAPHTFGCLVNWIYNEVVVRDGAPGLITGLSGTDSIVAFLAAYEAFKRAGKPHRVWGVHFAPSEEFLDDHPEAEVHTWFGDQVVPWLMKRVNYECQILIDTSIDWRMDGVRWGMLAEMGAVSYKPVRKMREHNDRFWLMGTRNRTEDLLYTYSNASLMCGVQPLVKLWKSEILQLSRWLGVPDIAIAKSCDVDCICGRQRLPAHHIREVDWLLMAREGEVDERFIVDNIPADLGLQLSHYIENQIGRSRYKRYIPYVPHVAIARFPPYVDAFEDHTLDLRTFDHRKHLYIAYCYLNAMSLDEALKRYSTHLKALLDGAGVGHKFSPSITAQYFGKLEAAMKLHPGIDFDELYDKAKESLT